MSRQRMLAAAALLWLTASVEGAAQSMSLDSLRHATATMGDSVDAARTRWITSVRRGTTVYDDSLVHEGVTLLFGRSSITDESMLRIREGITQGVAALERQLPGAAEILLAGDAWGIQPSKMSFEFASQREDVLRLAPGRDRFARGGRTLRLPVDTKVVREWVVDRAGQRLADLHPGLRALVGNAAILATDDAVHRTAARSLALSRSSVSRRCITGVTAACSALLSPDDAGWWDPEERPRIRTLAVLPAVGVSALAFAIEEGGSDFLRAVKARESESLDAVPLIAAALQRPVDDVLTSWLSRLQSARIAATSVPAGLLLSSLLWSVAFAAVVAIRRPR
ncbi:MAG: hypothetical protein KF709_02115 [Gemmatimonadaceae bacterium]|nr:hypothetical protein [Gemmatimonadaceae bacterium]